LYQQIKDIVILVFNKEKSREKVNWLIYGNKDRRLDKLFIPHSPVRSGGIKEEWATRITSKMEVWIRCITIR
jgi:hypothetical protein